MMRLVVAVLAVLAVACAQYSPQPGPLTVVTLANATLYNLFLPIQASDAAGYHYNLYRFWVPENTSSITLFFNNTYPDNDEDNCYDINFYVGNNGYLPCSEEEYDSDVFACANANEIGNVYNDEDGEVFSTVPADLDLEGLTSWSVGSWWYVGVAREDSDDYPYACSFQLLATLNSSCPVGSLGQQQDLSDDDFDYFGCSPAYYYQNTSNAVWAVSGTEQAVIAVVVATNTVGYITIQVNSTNDELFVFGASYSSPNDEEYACAVDDYTSEVGGTYLYNLVCYTPRQGDFYIVIFNDVGDDEFPPFTATASVSVHDCGSSVGGFNCSFPVVACNTSWNNFPVFIAFTEAQDNDNVLSGYWWYCYFDIPSNGTGSTWNFAVTVPAGSDVDVDNYVAVRKNGYNEYEEEGTQDGYFLQGVDVGDSVSLGFSVFEIYEPGRFYIGLLCYDPSDTTTGCNFTITANATAAPSTSGVSSTTTGGTGTSHGTTTTGGSTSTASTHGVSTSTASPVSTTASTGGGASSSPAVIVVPSIFFALVAVIALLL